MAAISSSQPQAALHSRIRPMEPSSLPWWPSPSATSSSGDRYWDATVQLLALGDSRIGGAKEPENDHGAHGTHGGLAAAPAIFQTYESGGAADKPGGGADLRLSATLSEDDIAFIVRNTADGDEPPTAAPCVATDIPDLAPQRAAPRRSDKTTALATISSTEEARRERNRLKVRRLYYRKLDRLNGLRSEVTDLEDRLESLQLASSNTSSPQPAIAAPAKPTVDYAALLEQLALTKRRLQHENEYLRLSVSQYIRSVHAMSVRLLAQHEPPTAYLRIKSVTRLECADLRRCTLTEVRNFARNRALFQHVGCICGWDSLHIICDGVFRFNVEKVVLGHRADEIVALSWAVLTDPPRFARVHSTAVDMKCYVLQEIDDDNFVIFHEYRTMNPSEETAMIARVILLVSRVTTALDHIITLTSLDHDKWVLEDRSASQVQDTVVWNDLFCWLQYREVDDGDGVACTFAGFAPIIGNNVYFWMVEIVQLAVRWESMTLGPAGYSLRTTDDGEAHSSEHAGGD